MPGGAICWFKKDGEQSPKEDAEEDSLAEGDAINDTDNDGYKDGDKSNRNKEKENIENKKESRSTIVGTKLIFAAVNHNSLPSTFLRPLLVRYSAGDLLKNFYAHNE